MPPFLILLMQFYECYQCLSAEAIQVTTPVVLSPLKAHCGVSPPLCCGACQVPPGPGQPWAAQGKGELTDQDEERDGLTVSINWAMCRGKKTPTPAPFCSQSAAELLRTQSRGFEGICAFYLRAFCGNHGHGREVHRHIHACRSIWFYTRSSRAEKDLHFLVWVAWL